jgi:hypothetical protein
MNFRELRACEVRRILLPRTRVHKERLVSLLAFRVASGRGHKKDVRGLHILPYKVFTAWTASSLSWMVMASSRRVIWMQRPGQGIVVFSLAIHQDTDASLRALSSSGKTLTKSERRVMSKIST